MGSMLPPHLRLCRRARFDADGGHDACAAIPWFQPLWPANDGSLHPNENGNLTMAAALTSVLGPPE